jgi:hypothetical protein
MYIGRNSVRMDGYGWMPYVYVWVDALCVRLMCVCLVYDRTGRHGRTGKDWPYTHALYVCRISPYAYALYACLIRMPGPDGTDVLEKIGASFGSAIRSQTSKFGKENGTPQSIPNEMSRSV